MLLFCKQPFYKQQQTEIGKKKTNKRGKYMFVEYLWNITTKYSQYIRRKFPMNYRGIFQNNVPGILNVGIFPDCSMNILQMLHGFF